LKLFDAHLYADGRTDADLENLAWFGVERVLLTAHAPRRFETAAELADYLRGLVEDVPDRFERFGLTASVAVGIHPCAVPRRAHYEIWRELPELLAHPGVAALGEIGLDLASEAEWRLVERQLRLLVDLQLRKPVLFRLPPHPDTRWRRNQIGRLAALVPALGLPPDDVIVLHVDWMTVDAVLDAGFHALLSVNPLFLSVQEALRILLHHDRRHLLAASSLRDGPFDVLALPRLAVALAEANLPTPEIARIVGGHAMALLVR